VKPSLARIWAKQSAAAPASPVRLGTAISFTAVSTRRCRFTARVSRSTCSAVVVIALSKQFQERLTAARRAGEAVGTELRIRRYAERVEEGRPKALGRNGIVADRATLPVGRAVYQPAADAGTRQ